MPKRKRRPYKGLLAIPTPLLDPWGSEQDMELYQMSCAVKLAALMDHYAIDRNDPENWRLLALYLALDYVPGFDHQRKRGAKQPIDEANVGVPYSKADILKTVADMELFGELHYERGALSVNAKVRHLTRTHPMFKGKNPDTLRERYYLLLDEKSPESKRLDTFMAEAKARKESGK